MSDWQIISRNLIASPGEALTIVLPCCRRLKPAKAWDKRRDQWKERFMKTSELVFIGIKGSVVALNRATGEQVWATRLKGLNFVNVVLQGEVVLASCDGEIFCLDPLTGTARWHNPLKGFGMGLATIATETNLGSGTATVLAEKLRHDEQAAASATAASIMV
jgi:putative pyrroloquinoline-quinone binding quinoprotein